MKKKAWLTEVDKFSSTTIYFNVKHLDDGKYELNIMNQNKPIKKVIFRKQ